MDRGEVKDTITALFRKYRWAGLILFIGLILMALPEGKPQPSEPATAQEKRDNEPDLQQQLESVLTKLEGAGRVKVLLSIASGSETHYQTDEDSQKTADSLDIRVETVIITAQDRSQQGLVRRTDPPVYLGAVVLCQGADSPAVKLAVVDAVGTATGLTSDKISVLKMK